MKIVEENKKEQSREKSVKEKLQEKESERKIALAAFRNSAAHKFVMEIIENEIRKSDVQNVIKKKGEVKIDAKTLEEIGKLTLIETMVADRLENIKKKISINLI